MNKRYIICIMLLLAFGSAYAQNRLQLSTEMYLISENIVSDNGADLKAFTLNIGYQNYREDRKFRSKILTIQNASFSEIDPGHSITTFRAQSFIFTFRRGKAFRYCEIDDKFVPYAFAEAGLGVSRVSEETLYEGQGRVPDKANLTIPNFQLGLGLGFEYSVHPKFLVIGEATCGSTLIVPSYVKATIGGAMRLY